MIYIDSNEVSHHPELKDRLKNCEIRNQNVDCIINGCSIEIKHSLDDLYSSVLDKRIWRQAQYLIENNGFFIILNQSTYFFKKTYKKKITVCDGAILSLIIDWKIPVLKLDTDGMLYSYLNKIDIKLSKEKKDKTYADFKKIGASDIDRHLGTLCQINGISSTKAKLIFEKFNDLGSILSAEAEDFAQLPGIGKKLSERIVAFFKWKWNKK